MAELTRFSDALWLRNIGVHNVSIGGAGGLGSYLAFYLGRMGCDITIYDNDTVDTVNLAGQLYNESHINMDKVVAIRDVVKEFSGTTISTLKKRVDEEFLSEVVFSCFDNMDARKKVFNAWLKEAEAENFDKFVFIDGRMHAEHYEVFCVHDKESAERYKQHLFDDAQMEDAPCTFKATSHCAAMCSANMAAVFTNWLSNIATHPAKFRSMPLRVTFNIATMRYVNEQ